MRCTLYSGLLAKSALPYLLTRQIRNYSPIKPLKKNLSQLKHFALVQQLSILERDQRKGGQIQHVAHSNPLFLLRVINRRRRHIVLLQFPLANNVVEHQTTKKGGKNATKAIKKLSLLSSVTGACDATLFNTSWAVPANDMTCKKENTC